MISVIIPAYNESQRIRDGVLLPVVRYMQEIYPYNHEIIIVNDGSIDDTATVAAEFGRVITTPHKGKAYAVMSGIFSAAGDVCLITDMDQATPISELEKTLWRVDQGTIVIGSRGSERENAPLSRRIIARSQILLRDLILGSSGIKDTQCGFKLFPTKLAKGLINKLSVYHPLRISEANGPKISSGWDVEFLYLAKRYGHNILEIPVVWNHKDTANAGSLRDCFNGVGDLLKIWKANFKGDYLPYAKTIQSS